ncbi:toxin [Herbaspirillum rubrisubalbicans]|jgi:hypothetical protein|uniref:Toxin n=1 Tax=Herbaspirillum rubrisubalbicans TaxID=80842 RepID=A0AAD0U9A7_9BURK|nr:type II toxin-antitoxin system RelE/ParE family toxin [Herbaspirillum rubrisubalbicans]ALU90498.1 hypothetical protein Hrubri_3338 [Herbaspirillum rubrisubalbicans M1]AYR25529.1 toxin [Herbaspirillum rubrisubalbicans]RAM64576.1 toxin [Herbaspirillum rubrisubalbicans]RAN49976.1 toxin [Herbaspirillum rubrisubalbicans]
MEAVFKETRMFEAYRANYLSDEAYAELQQMLMRHPHAGKLIKDTGGLRKIRFPDARRCKGKRGGLRVIYYFWSEERQFWLFSIYDKNEMADLTAEQRKLLKHVLEDELARGKTS